MKSHYIADLQPKQQVTTLFLVQSKDVRQKKSGEPYLSLVLSDRTGEIDCKMWDNVADVMDTFERDDFVRVKGEIQIHQNRLQLTAHKLVRVPDTEVDLSDFLPASARDPEEMFTELTGLVDSMRNVHLKALLQAIFADPAIAKAYKRAPAAKGIHHAWLGGLLEHVLSLCALARFAAAHYPGVDEDLLLAGVMLHDVGKTSELSYERSFTYSTDGQLLGHIVIGLQIVGDKIRQVPGFPPKWKVLLEHMILSHHGQLEFGSPKLPLFQEALLLHHLDNLDSKIETMRASLARDRTALGEWTSYNHALDRTVLSKEKYLAGPAAPRDAAPAGTSVKTTPAPASPHVTAAVRQASQFAEQLAAAIKKDS
jgi:3'-5' exoribonuclease